MISGSKPWPSAWRPLLVAGAALLLLLAMVADALAAGPSFPNLSGRVVDNANLMTGAEEAELTRVLEALEAKSTDQLVVVTLPSLQGYEIEEYGYQLGRHWGIGQKGKDNGVLLIVAPNERKVRIEVGRRLEPILTDGLTKLIIENTILPRFRRGGFGEGISAGAKDITDALLGDAEEVKRRAAGGSLQEDGLDWVAVVFLLIWFGIFFYIVWRAHRSAMRSPQTTSADGRQRRRRNADWVIVPGGWGGSGHWGGGSGGGGGWSGGGGGGFGGGGSSGSW